uniref:WAT1-related protein n=1 Tax=Aegilops tauschii subsp. strangulata TaxID=200361 RepID=A0A453QQF2_AEGTS
LSSRDRWTSRRQRRRRRWAGSGAPASMVLVQLFITGMILLSKVSIGGGMFIFVLLAYRSLFGAAFILPLALIFESGSPRSQPYLPPKVLFSTPLSRHPFSLPFRSIVDGKT